MRMHGLRDWSSGNADRRKGKLALTLLFQHGMLLLLALVREVLAISDSLTVSVYTRVTGKFV